MKNRSPLRILAFALLLAVAAPGVSGAAEEAGPHKVRVDLAFFTGFQRYAMDDVNGTIDELNAEFQADPVIAATGLSLDPLNGGRGYGAGIRVWPRRNVMIAFDYQQLQASTSTSVPLSSTPGAPSLNLEVRAPAHSLGIGAGYYFLRPLKPLNVGLGAGAEYYICDGAGVVSIPGGGEFIELYGTGFGGKGAVLADFALSEVIHLEAAVGYRVGKTSDLKDRGEPLLMTDGSKATADYTGVTARIGLDIPFGPR